MDINGDGHSDIITGHYWPGDIFVFYGEGQGKFSAMANLKDETGRNLNGGAPWASEAEPNMRSLAAAPYATDFDLDGDFDMLIGNIEGSIVLIENIGSAKVPKFSKNRTVLQANGAPIRVGGGDSGPVYEDWDQDGLRDLLSGAGDGSVMYYRNVGKPDAPKFAAGVALLPSSPDHGMKPISAGQKPTRPMARTKISVVDYNGDGQVDLLVGDLCAIQHPEPKLDAAQIAEREQLRTKRSEIEARMYKLWDALDEGEPTKEQEQQLEAVSSEFDRVHRALEPLEARTTSHGFVWYYQRKPITKAAKF
ncbi:MAG: VCBS repeat-containing protein [Planctomycetota bacterium]